MKVQIDGQKYTIDQGIKVWDKPGNGKWQRLAKKMKPGDSLVLNADTQAVSLAQAIRNEGHKAKIRALRDDKGLPLPQQRVWCL